MKRVLNIKSKRKLVWLVGLLIIVIAGVLLLTTHASKQSSINCANILKNSDYLYYHSKPQQAYNELYAQVPTCTTVSTYSHTSKITQAKIQTVSYDMALVFSALAVGNRQSEYSFTDQAANIFFTLTPQQKSQVPNNTAVTLQILSVQSIQKASQTK